MQRWHGYLVYTHIHRRDYTAMPLTLTIIRKMEVVWTNIVTAILFHAACALRTTANPCAPACRHDCILNVTCHNAVTHIRHTTSNICYAATNTCTRTAMTPNSVRACTSNQWMYRCAWCTRTQARTAVQSVCRRHTSSTHTSIFDNAPTPLPHAQPFDVLITLMLVVFVLIALAVYCSHRRNDQLADTLSHQVDVLYAQQPQKLYT
jgi:hypothetical protein